MTTITMTNAATGAKSIYKVNATMKAGQEFRMIGRTNVFRAVSVTRHPVAGLIVEGISLDGRSRCLPRVVDTIEPTPCRCA